MKVLRCAIYTRKSSEEGLEQSFNSLHAQREACEAYIRSQAHEGWKLVRAAYDDGGFSGGNLERPGLQRLMSDLREGRIDVVVVYKVDRLTRSLTDFAKIVETLDGHGASFVSVTQQFNTTSSMGRLTLNVLLSFAQFEREVAGERIRDKIALSKRKGMWMGGNPPLGYDVQNRQLVVNEAEAEVVRLIFHRYLELGCVRALMRDALARGITSKAWTSTTGRHWGGKPYSRGALYYLLRNPIYVGRIAHRGEEHPGLHASILEEALWDEVQAMLKRNRQGERTGRPAAAGSSLLTGRLYDDRGNLMSPSHTRKRGRIYRYYVSQALLQNGAQAAGSIPRVAAAAIEDLVMDRLLAWSREAGEKLPDTARRSEVVAARVARVVLDHDRVTIELAGSTGGDSKPASIVIPVVLRRERGGAGTVARDGSSSIIRSMPDRSLIRAIARAHQWLGLLRDGEVRSIADLARRERISPGYAEKIIRLAFLAPDIVEATIDGRQPASMSLADLLEREIPVSWRQQRVALGFMPATAT